MTLPRLFETQCIQLIALDMLYETTSVRGAALDALYLTSCIRHIEFDPVNSTHRIGCVVLDVQLLGRSIVLGVLYERFYIR